jgi:hypothetical protein
MESIVHVYVYSVWQVEANGFQSGPEKYKVVQIWPGLIVCKQVTVCPGHIRTTLYYLYRISSLSLPL